MSALDVLILVLAATAAYVGFRLGFVSRVLSWAGLAAGVALAIVLLPQVTTALGRTEARTRLIAALAFVIGVTLLGQALGLGLGGVAHAHFRLAPPLALADRIAGAVLGAVGVLLLVWLAIPALANAPGWPARAARDSTIVRAIDDSAPSPPDALEALARQVGATGPQVLERLGEPPDTGAPPAAGLAADVDARVRQSTVKVEGQACDVVQEGSGFVTAPGVVVTNAHVVAGESDTTVEGIDGRRHAAKVVAFDPNRDLALLRVPGLAGAPLTFGVAHVGTEGAVYGHPGGGPLTVSPARVADRITAAGRDIYGERRTERDVFVVASDIRPGDSGGALVDRNGDVVGVAFAIDPGHPGTAYALTEAEVSGFVDTSPAGSSAVSTGRCIVG